VFESIKELQQLEYPRDWILAIKISQVDLRKVVDIKPKAVVSQFSIHIPCVLIVGP
jgi:hypothetical protein